MPLAPAQALSLSIIGKLLGHTQAATTQRYAHLAADPVRQAADKLSGEIAAAMNSQAKGEVTPISEANLAPALRLYEREPESLAAFGLERMGGQDGSGLSGGHPRGLSARCRGNPVDYTR